MASSCNQGSEIGKRIKEARAALGMTQKALCEKSGMKLPSLRDYELGNRIPGGEAITAITRVGINSNWLLTGKGSMLLVNMRASTIAEFEDDYEELGRAFADVLGLSKDDLLQARSDVTKAMEGIKPDDDNFEGTYPKFLNHLRETYLNVARPLVSKSPFVRAAQTSLDMPRFLLAIEAVEEGLDAANRTMTPAKKAELFMAVYDLMEEPTNTKERVLKLVKLAA